jgi:hypothetical protein
LLLLVARLPAIYIFFIGIYKFWQKKSSAIELTKKGFNI